MKKLIEQIKKLPNSPGVYLFKDAEGHILYIGKAKNLKKRGASYIQRIGRDAKVDDLFEEGDHLDHQVVGSELEALVLEAQLIQSNQPKYNIIFKTGQPFLYLVITSAGASREVEEGTASIKSTAKAFPLSKPPRSLFGKLPELKIVRNRKQKGTYFGPFLEKEVARKVYDFLIKTFRLKLCKKKIEHGCLDYHLGICAGSCRPDFDVIAYQDRLALARRALEKGHKAFLDDLMEKIQEFNGRQEFERARELHGYYTACQKVFSYLDIKTGIGRVGHDVWILSNDQQTLHVFVEQQNVLKLKHAFYFPVAGISQPASFDTMATPFTHDDGSIRLPKGQSLTTSGISSPAHPECFAQQNVSRDYSECEPLASVSKGSLEDHMLAYYRTYKPASRILINFDLDPEKIKLYQEFLHEWHHLDQPVTILHPTTGHEAALIRYATVAAEQELSKRATLGSALKRFLKLDKEPKTIDCFDISHKQGTFMVGSCVRFTDGQPDKKFFRHFHIKTVKGQDDYACLAEIVTRRYRDGKDLPDLVVIDGGKGQLSATQKLVPAGVQVISLAKREETVFSEHLPEGKRLDQSSFVGQMLIALRDYAHHFAISFHRKTARDVLDEG